jgi:hypothetical protein
VIYLGYNCVMTLIDIKIKPDSLPQMKQALEKKKVKGFTEINWYFEHLVLDEGNFLCFKPRNDGSDFYLICDDGTTAAMTGSWSDDEKFASWIKQYSEKGGRIVLHSLEADGAAWGWEFNGKGKMRDLALCSIGKWK